MQKITVSEFVDTELRPKIPQDLERLMPNLFHPREVKLRITGINNAEGNAIRRTLMNELPVQVMTFDYADMETNDDFIIFEMIQQRFKLVPVAATASPDARFSLEITNNSGSEIYVYSRDIRGAKLPFNGTFPLIALKARKYIKIKNIRLQSDYAYNNAAHCAAYNCVLRPTELPEGNLTREQSSAIANYKDWYLEFRTSGAQPTRDLLCAAIDNIIDRTAAALVAVNNINFDGENYYVTLDGESATMGNLFMRAILTLSPDIDFVTFKLDTSIRSVRIITRDKNSDNPKSIYKAAAENITTTMRKLRDAITRAA